MISDRSAFALVLALAAVAAPALGCAKAGTSGSSSSDRKGEAEKQAAADLAAGNAKIMMASGIARFPLTPDVDRETGLPLLDTGCIVDQPFQDAYNAAVTAWVKTHGAPANSRKASMLAPATIDEALKTGAELAPDKPERAPDGRVLSLKEGNVHVEGGGFAHPFERHLGLLENDKVRFAWGPNGQVLIAVEGPPREGFYGKPRVQIDPGCDCLLQVLR